jgi:hypothetical protein
MFRQGGMMDLETIQETSPGHLAAERIALRRQVLDWRDHWSIEAELRLRMVWAARSDAIAAQIKALSHKNLALARTGYSPMPAVGELVEAIKQAANDIVADAEASLNAIVPHHLRIEAEAAKVSDGAGFDSRQLVAFGKTAAPIAAAAGLGIALPGLATTTSVALFGLVTTATVSVPILAAGIGGVTALSVLGVVSFSDLRADQERRLGDAIAGDLEKSLFQPVRLGREPSLLASLEAGLARAAEDLTGER